MIIIQGILLFAAVFAIFEAGYFFGRNKFSERERNLIGRIVGSVKIQRLDCDKTEVRAGQNIEIVYKISNKINFSYEVWLGASLESLYGEGFYDVSQDKAITLKVGEDTYSRYLTIHGGIPEGTLTLIGKVYFGERGNPSKSCCLDQKERDEKINILN